MSIFIQQQELLTSSDIPKSYWNLIDNSATFAGYTSLAFSVDEKVITPNGNKALTQSVAWNYPQATLKIKENQIYTFSFSARFADTSIGGIMQLYQEAHHSEIKILKDKAITLNEVAPNVWHRGFVTFKALKNATIDIGLSVSTNVKTDVGDYMANEGIYPLDWNYSLNDIRFLLGGSKAPL